MNLLRLINADDIPWTDTNIGDKVVLKTIIDNMPTVIADRVEVSASIFDTVERHDNCTVEVLTNSVTGEQSVGWWDNDNPPSSVFDEEDFE